MASNNSKSYDSAPEDGRATIARNGVSEAPSAANRPRKISTVSHTLHAEVAERLRYFAFRERISESAVIEYALRAFFLSGEETELGELLRASGAALRRKS